MAGAISKVINSNEALQFSNSLQSFKTAICITELI